jgi:outer membrane protein TolC
MRLEALLLLGAAVLAGCVTPPKEDPHPGKLVNADVGLTGAAVEPVAENWWDSFQDPQLDRLMRQGLKDSPTLAQAQARVGAALAQVQSEQAGLAPKVNFGASSLYQRAPENYFIPPPLAGHTSWVSQAGATLSWDLDFWGKQADAAHRARDLAQSAQLDEDDAQLMLAGAIAQTYIELYRRTLWRTSRSARRRSARTLSTSHAAASVQDSTRSSKSAKPRPSCRRRASRASRRRPPRTSRFTSSPP